MIVRGSTVFNDRTRAQHQAGRVRRLLKAGVARIWRDLERRYGLRQQVRQADRAEVDADFRHEFANACEAEVPELLMDYKQAAARTVRLIVRVLQEYRESATDSRRIPRVKGRRRTRADSEFHRRRRLRALAFVGERAIPLTQVLRPRLCITSVKHSPDG